MLIVNRQIYCLDVHLYCLHNTTAFNYSNLFATTRLTVRSAKIGRKKKFFCLALGANIIFFDNIESLIQFCPWITRVKQRRHFFNFYLILQNLSSNDKEIPKNFMIDRLIINLMDQVACCLLSYKILIYYVGFGENATTFVHI